MRLYLGLVFAGLTFFALPNFNLLDITPDFIGAILILIGLSKVCAFDDNFKDARKGAKYLLWISVLRLVLCVWANGGHRDYIMPFTFILCVLELIFMISTFRNLYLGLEYTLSRSDCERHLKNTSEAFTMSFLFAIVSRLLEFAPQICDILKVDSELSLSDNVSTMTNIAQMKTYILGTCLVCSLIVGIIYLFITAKAWFGVIADKKYSSFLKEKYDNYLVTEREKHLSLAIERTYLLLVPSVLFVFNFFIDGINIIPTIISAILLFSCVLSLSGFAQKSRKVISSLLCIGCIAATFVSYAFMTKIHFGINFLYASESFNSEQFVLLESKMSVFASAVISLVECILLCLLVYVCTKQMSDLFAREKRTVAVPMVGFFRVMVVLSVISSGVRNVLTTLEGHLATNTYVLEYIRNKTVMTKQVYDAYIQNPLVTEYEAVSTAAYVSSFVSAALVLISVLYIFRLRRFTEGDNTIK